MIQKPRKSPPLNPIQAVRTGLLLASSLAAPLACADDYRFVALLGYGGAALSKDMVVDSSMQTVVRNEGPAAFSLGGDYLLSDHWTLGFEHVRGIHLSPFSSGVSFTGGVGKWYFLGSVPATPKTDGKNTVLLQKSLTPYLGLGFGVAFANITRENELVENVKSSGFYLYPKAGVDWMLKGGLGARVEAGSASASVSATESIKAFHFLAGFFWVL